MGGICWHHSVLLSLVPGVDTGRFKPNANTQLADTLVKTDMFCNYVGAPTNLTIFAVRHRLGTHARTTNQQAHAQAPLPQSQCGAESSLLLVLFCFPVASVTPVANQTPQGGTGKIEPRQGLRDTETAPSKPPSLPTLQFEHQT